MACAQYAQYAQFNNGGVTMSNQTIQTIENTWPQRPQQFPELMTPVEAAMFLRLDQTNHNPRSAMRTMNYWRERGQLRATKFAKRVWFLKQELEQFLKTKTEE